VDLKTVSEFVEEESFHASKWEPSDSLASGCAEHLRSQNLSLRGQMVWTAAGAGDNSHMGNIHL